MDIFERVLDFFDKYGELLVVLLTAIVIPLIKSTRWGHANEKALEAVAQAIEDLNAKEVKEAISTKTSVLDDETAKAIVTAASKVDQKKPNPKISKAVKLARKISLSKE